MKINYIETGFYSNGEGLGHKRQRNPESGRDNTAKIKRTGSESFEKLLIREFQAEKHSKSAYQLIKDNPESFDKKTEQTISAVNFLNEYWA